MNIAEQINAEVEKITKNKELVEAFKKDPIKTVEQTLGKALPDEELKKIVDGVKAKINFDEKASGVMDSIKKLF